MRNSTKLICIYIHIGLKEREGSRVGIIRIIRGWIIKNERKKEGNGITSRDGNSFEYVVDLWFPFLVGPTSRIDI